MYDPELFRDLRELSDELAGEIKRSAGVPIVPLYGRGAGEVVRFATADVAARNILDGTHRRATDAELSGWGQRMAIEAAHQGASKKRKALCR